MGVIRCGSCREWESSGIGYMTPLPDETVRYGGSGVVVVRYRSHPVWESGIGNMTPILEKVVVRSGGLLCTERPV